MVNFHNLRIWDSLDNSLQHVPLSPSHGFSFSGLTSKVLANSGQHKASTWPHEGDELPVEDSQLELPGDEAASDPESEEPSLATTVGVGPPDWDPLLRGEPSLSGNEDDEEDDAPQETKADGHIDKANRELSSAVTWL